MKSDSPIRLWFNQLADADPKIRERAKVDLMGIDARDLPSLRQLVVDTPVISPDQAVGIHEIVEQVYLASQKYPGNGDGDTDAASTAGPFFLGILWPFQSLDDPPRLGVTVDQRLPGFPSNRFLRKGDMILGIYFHPEAPLLEWPNVVTHNRQALIDAINPGATNGADIQKTVPQNIVLEVLRDGETMKIPIRMAPRPDNRIAIDVPNMNRFNTDRIKVADVYWKANFQPLLDSRITASNLSLVP